MENQGFSQRGTSLALSLHARSRKEFKAGLLLSLSKQYNVSPNEYLLNRQACLGIQSVPTLYSTSDFVTPPFRLRKARVFSGSTLVNNAPPPLVPAPFLFLAYLVSARNVVGLWPDSCQPVFSPHPGRAQWKRASLPPRFRVRATRLFGWSSHFMWVLVSQLL